MAPTDQLRNGRSGSTGRRNCMHVPDVWRRHCFAAECRLRPGHRAHPGSATVYTLATPRPPCAPWLRHRARPGYAPATVHTLATPPSTRLTPNLSSWPATLNWCDRACVADGSFIRRVAYGEKNKARVLFVHTQNVCRSNVTCNFARCLPIIRVLRSIGLSMPRYDV